MTFDLPRNDPTFLAAYGATIRQVRTDRGLDRKDLAEAAHISYSYLSAIESGQRFPSERVQTALAEALLIPASDLLAQANDALHGEPPADSTQAFLLAEPAPEPPAATPSPATAFDRPGDAGITASGAIAELRVLLPSLSSEDAAMVVALARRLSTSGDSQRRTRSTTDRSSRQESRTEAYLAFWRRYLEELERRDLDWAHGRRPEPRSYFTTPSPMRGTSLSASFARNRLLRHELYINRGSRGANLELLRDFEARRSLIEEAYGYALDFEDPGRERRAVRIAEYRDGHIMRTDEFDEYVAWFIDRGIRMRRAMDLFRLES